MSEVKRLSLQEAQDEISALLNKGAEIVADPLLLADGNTRFVKDHIRQKMFVYKVVGDIKILMNEEMMNLIRVMGCKFATEEDESKQNGLMNLCAWFIGFPLRFSFC